MGSANRNNTGIVKLRLLVVGRGSRELAEFESRFHQRLRPFADFQVIELAESKARQTTQRKQEEAKHILSQANKGFVLFDERGSMLPSTKWAAHLQRLVGNAQLDFVIGGADGIDDSVRQQASACWSLSKLTLPHQLVRAIVLEQLYRAFTIIQGHPYHRP